MEELQQEDRLDPSPIKQGNWPNTFQSNFQTNRDSQPVSNIETYQMYDCDENDENAESQEIFEGHSGRNSVNQIEDNCNADLGDKNVIGLNEMGKDCLEMKEEIDQKLRDIRLLKDNAKLLRAEVEENQKALEMAKVELLTEQDNYDDIQKKLNEEIELITAIGLQQEALNNRTMSLLEQKLKVEELLEHFDTEFSIVKLNGENILQIFEEKINELKLIMQTISKIKIEIDNKKTYFSNNNQDLEDRLKVKTNEMERMHDNLKVKHCQQTAILNYLNLKGDEEWSKCKELESELQCLEKNKHQQLDLEENHYVSLCEKEESNGDELLKLKKKIFVDKTHLDQLILEKNNLLEEVGKLQQKETVYVQKCSNAKETLSTIVTDSEKLEQTMFSKNLVKKENIELIKSLDILRQNKSDVLEKKMQCDNLIVEANKRCSDVEEKLQGALKEQQINQDITNNLDDRKIELLGQFEEIKGNNKTRVDYLENERNILTSENEMLEGKILEINNEIQSHSITADKLLIETLKIKEHFKNNSEKIVSLSNEVEELNGEIFSKQNQFQIQMSVIQEEVHKKEATKSASEAEINKRLDLQSEIEHLKGELRVIDSQCKDEIKSLNDKNILELKVIQDDFEMKKNELDSICREKKAKVSELQEEIIDEQKNELHLVKMIQKLSFIYDKNKRELIRLRNVIQTLDSKLTMIAQTVTNSIKDKESIICSQSTLVSGGMGPSATQKIAAKPKRPADCDSSSSGISMNDNDPTWKRRLLMKQQEKQLNTQILTQKSSSVVEDTVQTKATSNAGHGKENKLATPKKKTGTTQRKTPVKKTKK